jgi:hypothetical protein
MLLGGFSRPFFVWGSEAFLLGVLYICQLALTLGFEALRPVIFSPVVVSFLDGEALLEHWGFFVLKFQKLGQDFKSLNTIGSG